MSHLISTPLSRLIDLCVKNGCYPDILKVARVVPVFKKGSKQLMNNYRPISILSNFNKIFETFILKRMKSFAGKYKLINSNQFGFTAGKSTNNAIQLLIKNALETFGRGDVMIAIFLDLSKAFDCTDHMLLLNKLYRYGYCDSFWNMLSSYLHSRKQFVDVAGYHSDHVSVLHGVPQGSVLGPFLFLLYINDINFILTDSLKILFADDTVVCRTGSNIQNVVANINEDLAILQDWLNANLLILNKTKTNALIFTYQKHIASPPIHIDDDAIQVVDSFNYLGLIIDSKLKFKEHIDVICSKISRSVGVLYSLKYLVPLNVLKTLYYSIVYPHLLLHINVWGAVAACSLKRAQIAQNKAVRCILAHSSENLSTVEMYNRLELLDVNRIFNLQCCIFVNDLMYNDDSVYHNYKAAMINEQPHHSLRYALNLRPPFPRLEVHLQSALYNGISLWNKLPQAIRLVTDAKKFKKQVLKII